MCTIPVANIFNCPQCNSIIDVSGNRIVVESCGHKKCRNCFLNEENGCAECQNTWNTTPVIISSQIEESDTTDLTILTTNEQKSLDSNSDSGDLLQIDTDQDGKSDDEHFPAPVLDSKKIVILNEVILKSPDNPQISSESLADNPNEQKNTGFVYPYLLVKRIKGQNIFHCTICEKEFKSKNNRRYHLYCDKTIEKPYKCTGCQKVSKTQFR